MDDNDDFVDALDDADYEDDDDIDMGDVQTITQPEEECEVLSECQVYSHMNEAIQDVSAFIEVNNLFSIFLFYYMLL